MAFFYDLAELGFLQRAFLSGLLISGLCSILSVFVVYQKLAFIGQGISHAAFGGIALGLLITGADNPNALVNLITALFALAIAALITESTRDSKLSSDTAIGVFFAVSMALGLVLLALRENYTAQAFSYLFGSILAVSQQDLYLILGLFLVVMFGVRLLWKELVAVSFDAEMAEVTGIPVRLVRHLLLAMLAVTIVVAMKLVGAVLVSAFLVIPGATAAFLGKRFNTVVVLSAIFAFFATCAGLYLSYALELPSGATIVLCQFVFFVLAWTSYKLRGVD